MNFRRNYMFFCDFQEPLYRKRFWTPIMLQMGRPWGGQIASCYGVCWKLHKSHKSCKFCERERSRRQGAIWTPPSWHSIRPCLLLLYKHAKSDNFVYKRYRRQGAFWYHHGPVQITPCLVPILFLRMPSCIVKDGEEIHPEIWKSQFLQKARSRRRWGTLGRRQWVYEQGGPPPHQDTISTRLPSLQQVCIGACLLHPQTLARPGPEARRIIRFYIFTRPSQKVLCFFVVSFWG
jgi:hypothetical protein